MNKVMTLQERVEFSGQALKKYPRWVEVNNKFQGGGVKRERFFRGVDREARVSSANEKAKDK